MTLSKDVDTAENGERKTERREGWEGEGGFLRLCLYHVCLRRALINTGSHDDKQKEKGVGWENGETALPCSISYIPQGTRQGLHGQQVRGHHLFR